MCVGVPCVCCTAGRLGLPSSSFRDRGEDWACAGRCDELWVVRAGTLRAQPPRRRRNAMLGTHQGSSLDCEFYLKCTKTNRWIFTRKLWEVFGLMLFESSFEQFLHRCKALFHQSPQYPDDFSHHFLTIHRRVFLNQQDHKENLEFFSRRLRCNQTNIAAFSRIRNKLHSSDLKFRKKSLAGFLVQVLGPLFFWSIDALGSFVTKVSFQTCLFCASDRKQNSWSCFNKGKDCNPAWLRHCEPGNPGNSEIVDAMKNPFRRHITPRSMCVKWELLFSHQRRWKKMILPELNLQIHIKQCDQWHSRFLVDPNYNARTCYTTVTRRNKTLSLTTQKICSVLFDAFWVCCCSTRCVCVCVCVKVCKNSRAEFHCSLTFVWRRQPALSSTHPSFTGRRVWQGPQQKHTWTVSPHKFSSVHHSGAFRGKERRWLICKLPQRCLSKRNKWRNRERTEGVMNESPPADARGLSRRTIYKQECLVDSLRHNRCMDWSSITV